jgi:NAD(P)-dependent dehydrogenase (short-subunit alcohol dehydrogenase family)
VALRLADEGVSVLCCDVARARRVTHPERPEEHQPTDELVRARGGQARFHETDVADEGSFAEAFDQAEQMDGPVRICVLNAGIFGLSSSLVDDSLENHDAILRVNERGVWLGCREAGRRFIRYAQGGNIVCTASISGLVGLPGEAAYAASKGAVVALVRAAARDLAPHRIRINAVAPGLVRTPMTAEVFESDAQLSAFAARTPLGDAAQPRDVAAAVAFLASDDAAFITGVTLPVDGGYSNA